MNELKDLRVLREDQISQVEKLGKMKKKLGGNFILAAEAIGEEIKVLETQITKS